MKKIFVLCVLLAFNVGAIAQDLIFSDDFESGWPNAWSQVVGWSPFFVKDSTDAVVGPVVGFWSDEPDAGGESGLPQVAVWVNNEKVVFRAQEASLGLGRDVYYENADCQGQAYLCISGCENGGGTNLAVFQGYAYAVGPGNVLYRAAPPAGINPTYSSFSNHSENILGGFFNCNNVGSDTPLPSSYAWPATPGVDLDTLFIPPFILE